MSEQGTGSAENQDPESEGPRTVEIRSRTLVLVGATLIAAAVLGVGAFFYGKSTGEDLDAAREAGTQAGRAEGAREGSARGYAAGFKKGREKGYDEAYGPAFTKSYKEAYVKAGLDAPADKDIPLPDSSK